MTAHVLVTGSIYRPPEQRTSKAGKPFVTATVREEADDNETRWWNVVAFSESVQAELTRLADGDSLCVQGACKIGTYDKDGVSKISLSIVADRIIALRQPRRAAGAEAAKAARNEAPFDDAVPF